MTITTYPTRNEYTATAGQTIFNYTFKVFAATDLRVFVTPSGQVADDSTDEVFGFAVTGEGSESGGTITLVVAASLGDKVTIVGAIPSSRTTDYQNNGDFLPDTVNDDFDRVVALTKQVEDLANRVLAFEKSQQGASGLTLPAPSSGQFLKWKSDLSGIENSSATIVSQLAYDPLTVYTVGFPVIGSNGYMYISLIANGPGTVAGVVNPVGDVTGTWKFVQFTISDIDLDTYITCEESADEDKIHAYLAGVKKFTLDSNGLSLVDDLLVKTKRMISGSAASTQLVMRQSYLQLQDGTTGVSVAATFVAQFNGDAIGATDNIAKGDTSNNFELASDGLDFTIHYEGLSGKVVSILSTTLYSDVAAALDIIPSVVADDIFFSVHTPGDYPTPLDLTTLVDTGPIIIIFTYLTDA